MTVNLQHNDLTIELFDDSPYVINSIDSPTHYDMIYNGDNYVDHDFPTRHGIKVFKGGQLYKSAILLGAGGATGISSDAALIDNENLIIRCSNQLFSLTLPELTKNWQIKPDWATCFSIYKYQDTYISHGEATISRIDKTGKILWSFSGADIFVCLYEGNPFEMHDTYIALTDFNGSKYKIDYDGNSLDYIESDYHKQEPIAVLMKPQKQWWKFW
jgi:hypothetical protein